MRKKDLKNTVLMWPPSGIHRETYGHSIGDDVDLGYCLSMLDSVTEGILGGNLELFSVESCAFSSRKVLRVSALGEELRAALGVNITKISTQLCKHRLNPRIELFSAAKVYEGIIQSDLHLEAVAQVNGWVARLREVGRSATFRNEIASHLRRVREAKSGLKAYARQVMWRRTELIAVRMTLQFRERLYGVPPADQPTAAEVEAGRALILEFLPKHFGSFAGYVGRLDYRPAFSFTYDLLVLFDGAETQADVTLGQIIGDYWVTSITQGKGSFSNQNNSRGIFTNAGQRSLGRLMLSNKAVRDELLAVMLHFVLVGHLVNLDVPGIARPYTRAALKSKDAVKKRRMLSMEKLVREAGHMHPLSIFPRKRKSKAKPKSSLSPKSKGPVVDALG